MKQNANKQNRYGSPILAGYSDKRVHRVMTICMIAILIFGPFVGFIATTFFTLLIGLFVAFGAAKYQGAHYRSELLYRQTMDQIYYNGVNAEYYEDMLGRYKSRSEIKRLKNADAFNSAQAPKARSNKVLSLQLDN